MGFNVAGFSAFSDMKLLEYWVVSSEDNTGQPKNLGIYIFLNVSKYFLNISETSKYAKNIRTFVEKR